MFQVFIKSGWELGGILGSSYFANTSKILAGKTLKALFIGVACTIAPIIKPKKQFESITIFYKRGLEVDE